MQHLTITSPNAAAKSKCSTSKSGSLKQTYPTRKRSFFSLRQRKDVVVKPADKGGAAVVRARDLYIQEAERQLSDSAYYQKLDCSGADMCRFCPELFILRSKHQILRNDIIFYSCKYLIYCHRKLFYISEFLNFFQNGRRLDRKWNLVLPEVSFFLLKLILMLDKTSPCLFSTISAWKIMHYYDYLVKWKHFLLSRM